MEGGGYGLEWRMGRVRAMCNVRGARKGDCVPGRLVGVVWAGG